MSHRFVRSRRLHTILDAIGNTTKALTKGYAIASASLAAFLLFSAYIDKVNLILQRQIDAGLREAGTLLESVDLANVNVFIAALIGAMLVYFFSSLAIRAVGTAAQAIIVEVRRQFREMPGIMDYTQRPDYARVVDITTRAALRQMILPGTVAVATAFTIGVSAIYFEVVTDLIRPEHAPDDHDVDGIQQLCAAEHHHGAFALCFARLRACRKAGNDDQRKRPPAALYQGRGSI